MASEVAALIVGDANLARTEMGLSNKKLCARRGELGWLRGDDSGREPRQRVVRATTRMAEEVLGLGSQLDGGGRGFRRSAGAARTQAPTGTNYDVGSTTWVDLRQAPLQSAMEVTNLGHGPSRSPIDPVQAVGGYSKSSKTGKRVSWFPMRLVVL
ncbi:hypothetical protein RJ639_025621, partial [Escallonia herrerae]